MNSLNLPVRGLQYHVQEWGDSSLPTLFLLHGWMDCGASFKFVVKHLGDQFHVIAPDLRGFGDTEHAPSGYWFPDYFADLEVLISHFSPRRPIYLAGHSMGGNIALLYAGIQPHRVSRVLSLDALGLPPTHADDAVGKYRQWMTETLSQDPPKIYPSANLLKHSIYKGNPRLTDDMIEELAVLWGKPVGKGDAWRLKHDHRHRYTNPVRYNYDDTLEIWRQISGRAGLLVAQQSPLYQRFGALGRIEELQQVLSIAPQDYFELPDCGHMMHLEQPDKTADAISEFFTRK